MEKKKKDYALYFSQPSDVMILSSILHNPTVIILEQERSVNAPRGSNPSISDLQLEPTSGFQRALKNSAHGNETFTLWNGFILTLI